EKFTDVVNWLKANATKAENSTPGAGVGASFGGKKFLPEKILLPVPVLFLLGISFCLK
ncbi:RanBP1 domain-containing protein, partial [Trifolium medium]|nr:RanBP1 domain-containing protein [Trifolium medium]